MTIKIQRYLGDTAIPRTGRELTPGEEVWLSASSRSILHEMARGVKAVDERNLDLKILRDRADGESFYKTIRLEGDEINRAGIKTNHTIAPYRVRFEKPTLPPQAKR